MTENNNHVNPRVFISYSWDSPEHKLWVESLARELRNCGIDARLDSWRDESQSIDDFMMIELERADYVVVICTPQFKRKIVENAEGVASTASGFEMGTAAALRRSRGKDIIPVLRAGDWVDAAPSSLLSYRYYDFTQSDISNIFVQLRDRLLGHHRRPPKMGVPSGPAAKPELPDIFASGSRSAATTQTAQAAATPAPPPQSSSIPSQPQGVAAPAPVSSGKKWMFVGAGAVITMVVLLSLVPTDEETWEPTGESTHEPLPQQQDVLLTQQKNAISNDTREIAQTATSNAANTGSINIRYTGDSGNCSVNIAIWLENNDLTITPTGNFFSVDNLILGDDYYEIAGTISCPQVGSCVASGEDGIDLRNGYIYDIVWENADLGQCNIGLFSLSQ